MAFLFVGGKRFNGKCMEPFFALYRSKNQYVSVPKGECHRPLLEEINLQSHWSFHKNIAVNTVVVDQSIYTRNAMLSCTLTVLRTIIHETKNLLYCFLPEVLIM